MTYNFALDFHSAPPNVTEEMIKEIWDYFTQHDEFMLRYEAQTVLFFHHHLVDHLKIKGVSEIDFDAKEEDQLNTARNLTERFPEHWAACQLRAGQYLYQFSAFMAHNAVDTDMSMDDALGMLKCGAERPWFVVPLLAAAVEYMVVGPQSTLGRDFLQLKDDIEKQIAERGGTGMDMTDLLAGIGMLKHGRNDQERWIMRIFDASTEMMRWHFGQLHPRFHGMTADQLHKKGTQFGEEMGLPADADVTDVVTALLKNAKKKQT